jgi:hypothetical protein
MGYSDEWLSLPGVGYTNGPPPPPKPTPAPAPVAPSPAPGSSAGGDASCIGYSGLRQCVAGCSEAESAAGTVLRACVQQCIGVCAE